MAREFQLRSFFIVKHPKYHEMKRTILLIGVAVLAAASCSKSPKTTGTTPSGTKTAFQTLFPNIDTCTLWNVATGGRTGSTAKIDKWGNMIVTGFSTPLGETYSGGSYKIRLRDSTSGDFSLLRSGPDTVISEDCSLGIDTSKSGRPYYVFQMNGGNLPLYAIVRGDFVDSL